MQDSKTAAPKKLHGIVEIFGHQRVAGEISELTIGGCSMVRVDIPEVRVMERTRNAETDEVEHKLVRTIQAHTVSYGAGAIYAINFCDADTALVSAHSIQHEPLTVDAYSLRTAIQSLKDEDRQRLLTSHRIADDEPF